MPYPTVARKLVITIILSLLALYLVIAGASAYQGTDWALERAIYFSGAAIVFAIVMIPWMIKESDEKES